MNTVDKNSKIVKSVRGPKLTLYQTIVRARHFIEHQVVTQLSQTTKSHSETHSSFIASIPFQYPTSVIRIHPIKAQKVVISRVQHWTVDQLVVRANIKERLAAFEKSYLENKFPTNEEMEKLAIDFCLKLDTVHAWFKNRRNADHYISLLI